MRRASCVGDSEDWQGPGGHARSENRPRLLPAAERGRHRDVALVIRTDDVASVTSTQGFWLWLVNGSQERQGFDACDSLLPIVQEARDRKGTWRPIECVPSSWCGNSYHRVFLKPGEHWAFAVPRYQGPFATQLRFRLDRREQPPVYSAEFEGSIHEGQFERQKAERPFDATDPNGE